MNVQSVVIYGDFNCPRSYLAARRAERLAANGVRVDWRAVEHEPACSSHDRLPAKSFDEMRAERDQVVRMLLPAERLAHSLAGFVPCTKAAVSGYAEAYAAGVAAGVRQLLFDAFWLHAVDVGDAKLVRTLLVDAIRSGSSHSEALREWGYAVDVNGAPITTAAHRLISSWKSEWLAAGERVIPVLMVDDDEPLFGEAAVRWLGEELSRRNLDFDEEPSSVLPRQRAYDDHLDLSWTTQHGGKWNRAYQDAHKPALLEVGNL